VGQGVPAVLAIMLVAIGTRSPYAATSLAFAAGILNCDVKNLGQIGACEVIHVAARVVAQYVDGIKAMALSMVAITGNALL
jgi:hypothetical protein